MTGLVFLFINGLLIIACSESRQGRWAGGATTVLAATGIVALTVINGVTL